jgi:Uma2 family endonuclease
MPQPAIEEVDQQTLPLTEEEMKEFEAAVAALVTEDDTPVDNPFSEKQQRLLAEALYTGWSPPPNEEYPQGGRAFWAAANVGLFPTIHKPAIVPDLFLSLDVSAPGDRHKTKSYFFWEFGKAPEVVIEIVSNTIGGELSGKKFDYARLGVRYYIVYDPDRRLSDDPLQVFVLRGASYEKFEDVWLPEIGLGLTMWRGVFEDAEDTYLRWVDQQGNLLPTGKELAEREAERAEREAKARRQAEARAAQLAAKLRELGLDPDQI